MKKRYKAILYSILILVFIFSLSIFDNDDISLDNSISLYPDSLVSAMKVDNEIYSNEFSTALQYELLKEYYKDHSLSFKFLPPYKEGKDNDNYWAMLIRHEIDILVINPEIDSIPKKYADGIALSTPLENSVWAVRRSDIRLLGSINAWRGYYRQTYQFSSLKEKYYRSYRLKKYIKNKAKTYTLSPYDFIIKKNAKLIGWDWRLLAALIYQESRFSMGAHSSKGAIGLMQIKPSTAEYYGVDDIFNPNNNIKAGVLHLIRMQKLFKRILNTNYKDTILLSSQADSTIDISSIDTISIPTATDTTHIITNTTDTISKENLIKFTLAAYNAGEGNISKCITYAISQKDINYRNWEDVASCFDKIKNFRGDETINYVQSILEKYQQYLEYVY